MDHQPVVDQGKELKASSGNAAQRVEMYRSALQQLTDSRKRTKDEVAQVEHEISRKADELIRAIQQDKKQLLDDLASVERIKMLEMDDLCSAIEERLASVETPSSRTERLLNGTRTPNGAAQERKVFDDLLDNAASGLQQALKEVTSFSIEFTPAEIEADDRMNAIGLVNVSTCQG
jgi:hypothetical protein